MNSELMSFVRYAILVSDTVKIGQEKAVCLTEGTKATNEVMFFFQVSLSLYAASSITNATSHVG
jgi:nucleosome binding factor SPN SPT16 subunit